MPYATQEELIARGVTQAELVQLTDDTKSGAVDPSKVTAVLTEASATVDSYCRLRYAIPLQTSEKVKGLTVDIAVYMLFARRRRVPDDVKERNHLALKFLQDVAAGKAALDQPPAAPPQSAAAAVQATQMEERFSDDKLEGLV